jgi:16S rRNA (guanine1207-N2)-methyltransferase
VPSPQPGGADHYFSPAPDSPSAPRDLELVLPEGLLVRLAADQGVFSGDRVDPGTRALLVDGPPVAAGGTLADVGCGYGPIAVTLALRGGPGTVVWAVDVNERARDLCRANAELNGVADRVRVVAPHDVPADLVVDQAWSNPPIRIGKAPLHDLLAGWLGRLRPGTGHAALVVHRHLGADSLTRWLDDQGWPTERLATRAGYRILQVAARTEAASGGTTPDAPASTHGTPPVDEVAPGDEGAPGGGEKAAGGTAPPVHGDAADAGAPPTDGGVAP